MKSIRFVQNGKGQLEPVALRSTVGLSLLNANGDVNSSGLGFQVAIDTLTYIKKQITEQKFYEVPVADYIPMVVGEGAFSQNLLTNLTFSNSDNFESGNINMGEGGSRLAEVDASVATKTIKVINWAKSIGYTIFDIEQALMSNNWDRIESLHRARATNWQLGLQEIAFLGSRVDTAVPGLFTNSNVTVDTTTITKLINSMTATELDTFVRALIATYRAATNYSAMPDTFVIPEDDWLGLPALTPGTVGTYPYPRITYLEEAFKRVAGQGFRVLPSAYGIPANNASRSGLNKHLYALYRKDPTSIRMDVPVDYTTTQPNTLNNFSFQDVGYGQYTGVQVLRNLEMIYFQF